MIKQDTVDRYRSYIGKQFGSIKVNDIDLSIPNRIYFLCTCLECKKDIRVRNDGLHDKTACCSKCMGKWRKENFEKRYIDALPKDIRYKYIHFKCNAKRKNRIIPFELTKEECEKMCESNCFYCNCKRCLGIDRVDNNKGYTVQNCVPCCGICNTMKMDMTKESFIIKISQILNNITKSSTTIPKGSTSQANGDGNGRLLNAA